MNPEALRAFVVRLRDTELAYLEQVGDREDSNGLRVITYGEVYVAALELVLQWLTRNTPEQEAAL